MGHLGLFLAEQRADVLPQGVERPVVEGPEVEGRAGLRVVVVEDHVVAGALVGGLVLVRVGDLRGPKKRSLKRPAVRSAVVSQMEPLCSC